MSRKCLWNPATKPDKAERPDMSRQSLWNPAMRLYMSGLTGVFGGMIDFDILHFTNSANESPLIVRNS
jgi:hypothetical protein